MLNILYYDQGFPTKRLIGLLYMMRHHVKKADAKREYVVPIYYYKRNVLLA